MKGKNVVERIYFGPEANREQQRAFEALLKERHCDEMGRFFSSVAELRAKPSSAQAREIFAHFIDDTDSSGSLESTASDTLNLSAATRESIRKQLLAHPESPAVFDEAVDECARLCVQNGFAIVFEERQRATRQRGVLKYAVALGWIFVIATVVTVAYTMIYKL
jgi:histidinol phosphatase-like PHP family hydrolase